MKYLMPIAAAALLSGCSAYDQVREITDIASTSQTRGARSSQPYNRPRDSRNSQPYNQNAYGNGYQQGYDAGYYDAGRGRGYRAKSKSGGSSYNSAFSDGYYKGYEAGTYDARARRGYKLR
jgi:hypothetical protein